MCIRGYRFCLFLQFKDFSILELSRSVLLIFIFNLFLYFNVNSNNSNKMWFFFTLVNPNFF